MSEDLIIELTELLEYAVDERDWNSVEEALSLIKEDDGTSDKDEDSI